MGIWKVNLLLRITALALGVSSLFWFSWAFFYMSLGFDITFREPRPYVAFAEFLLSGSAALALGWEMIKETKKK